MFSFVISLLPLLPILKAPSRTNGEIATDVCNALRIHDIPTFSRPVPFLEGRKLQYERIDVRLTIKNLR